MVDQERFRAGLVCVLILMAPLGCSRGKADENKGPPPAPVRIGIATVASVPVEVRAIGTAEASATASIRPRVTGLIKSVAFSEGQEVSEGDILFRLDPEPFEAALREAESNLQRSRAEAANAAAEAARYNNLFQAGVASRQDADQRNASAKALAAAVESFRAATLARKLDLEYATIRAPIAGRTGSILVREGNLVRANETLLVEIRRLSPAFVTFTIPEAELPTLQRYASASTLPVTASASGDAGPPETGTLTFVDSTVDRATGTVQLRGTFENAQRTLWPGQFVDVTVTLEVRQGAIVIPSSALQTGPQGSYVYVVGAEDKAEMRKIQPGPRVAGNGIVVESGLSGGERVVTDGQLRLAPGSKVTIVQDAPAPPAAGDGG